MAEQHGADRDESREPDDGGAPVEKYPGQGTPLDEEAAWQAIVAGYGEEPADPPGAKPFKSVEDLALLEPETNDGNDGNDGADGDKDEAGTKETKNSKDSKDSSGPGGSPLGSSVSFAPGVGGPRDYTAPEPTEDDFDADDEGHFVPPDPPLPEADVTAKFAWLAVIGGPVLILLAVLLGWDMTWWLTTLGIGGFLGGFATLVIRMKGDDEEDDDPGRGAVV
ncbi:hypothetical protein [Streptomyces sp. NPDC059009]|uniref:hypothetical protein n=1 Tax=Streptomyces sp. NPDC059009 TaxID=3346694 RepID=UPI00369B1A12